MDMDQTSSVVNAVDFLWTFNSLLISNSKNVSFTLKLPPNYVKTSKSGVDVTASACDGHSLSLAFPQNVNFTLKLPPNYV